MEDLDQELVAEVGQRKRILLDLLLHVDLHVVDSS